MSHDRLINLSTHDRKCHLQNGFFFKSENFQAISRTFVFWGQQRSFFGKMTRSSNPFYTVSGLQTESFKQSEILTHELTTKRPAAATALHRLYRQEDSYRQVSLVSRKKKVEGGTVDVLDGLCWCHAQAGKASARHKMADAISWTRKAQLASCAGCCSASNAAAVVEC